MHFHTWTFLLFFLVAYAVFLLLRATRFRNLWLLVVSYVFYGCWHPLYPVLMAYATLVDYVALACMEKSERKRVWLCLSLGNGLLLLGFFKYGLFVTENLNLWLDRLGCAYTLAPPALLLPLGMSFYMFRSLSYVIDCYRGQVTREANLIRHATFVGFFPILLAGPIARAGQVLPQLRRPAPITGQDLTDGLSLFVVGLFKKCALADGLALYVNPIYGAPEQHQAPALILATLGFAWQIYFDFSGYTDMARGLARALGFDIMLNFKRPYLATGLGDFWRRWHISLSTWFRDYVYIPLGGSRRGAFMTYRNIFLTMVISGLWHGAAWTFVIWGALHGLGMIATREMERSEIYQQRIPRPVKQAGTFVFVSFAWIFFRAPDWDSAWLIVTRIFGAGLADPRFPLLFAGLILGVWIYECLCESRLRAYLINGPVRISLILFMLIYLCLFSGSAGQAFIYNQF